MNVKSLCTVVLLFSLLMFLNESYGLPKVDWKNDAAEELTKADTFSSLSVQKRTKRFYEALLITIVVASAISDIYHITEQCNDYTPTLIPTIENANALYEKNIQESEDLNLAWVPIESKESYTQRLASDTEIIEAQLTNIDSLTSDVIVLLDPDIADKIIELEEEMETKIENNETESDIGAFEDLEEKYAVTGYYSIRLSVKAIPDAIYTATFEALPKLAARYTAFAARNWAASNPSKVYTLLGSYADVHGTQQGWVGTQIDDFKHFLNDKWFTFKTNHPTFDNAIHRFQNTRVVRSINSNLPAIKTGIVAAGKGIYAGFLIGYEIYYLIEFKEDCEDKLKEAEHLYDTLLEQEQNLTAVQASMNSFSSDVDRYYEEMRSNFTTNDILNYLAEIVELSEDYEDQTDDFVKATADVQYYIDHINDTTNASRVDELNKFLITALDTINFVFDCLHSRISIIVGITQSCEKGENTFEEIFKSAQAEEAANVRQECLNGSSLTESEAKQINDEEMELIGKETICIRNNEDKKSLACSSYYDDISNEEIVTNLSPGVTLEDVEYFISICPPGNISESLATAICSGKTNGVSEDETLNYYSIFDSTQVSEAYDGCNLTQTQEGNICAMKDNGDSLEVVGTSYSLYPIDKVEAAYDSCPKKTEIDPIDGTVICMLLQNMAAAQVQAIYEDEYEADALIAYIDSCEIALK